MVATIVLLMLLAWLACTAAMTIRAGSGVRQREANASLDVRRLSGAPTPSQTYSTGDGER